MKELYKHAMSLRGVFDEAIPIPARLPRFARNDKFLLLFIFLGISYQFYLSWNGIRNWSNGDYTHASYEEESAKIVHSKIVNRNSILITAFPESYYYFTGIPANTPDAMEPMDNNYIIIIDQAMRDLYPETTQQFLSSSTHTRITSYRVNAPFYYAGKRYKNNGPVEVYQVAK